MLSGLSLSDPLVMRRRSTESSSATQLGEDLLNCSCLGDACGDLNGFLESRWSQESVKHPREYRRRGRYLLLVKLLQFYSSLRLPPPHLRKSDRSPVTCDGQDICQGRQSGLSVSCYHVNKLQSASLHTCQGLHLTSILHTPDMTRSREDQDFLSSLENR